MSPLHARYYRQRTPVDRYTSKADHSTPEPDHALERRKTAATRGGWAGTPPAIRGVSVKVLICQHDSSVQTCVLKRMACSAHVPPAQERTQ